MGWVMARRGPSGNGGLHIKGESRHFEACQFRRLPPRRQDDEAGGGELYCNLVVAECDDGQP